MPTVYLLRHGESQSNVEERYQGQGDSPLTKQGRAQAAASRERLKKIPFVAAYASHLSRAQETATIIATPHRLNVNVVKGLQERHYGTWEGKRAATISKTWPKPYQQWLTHPNRVRIPKAETLKQLQIRAVRTFKQIIKPFAKADAILMVAHGGWNRALLFAFLGLDLDKFWHIRQSNCGLNIIEVHSQPVVRTINAPADIRTFHATRY